MKRRFRRSGAVLSRFQVVESGAVGGPASTGIDRGPTTTSRSDRT